MKHDINVPTLEQFKSLTGRSGAGRAFKRKNDIDKVFEELSKYDRFRTQFGPEPLNRLRALRRACIAWLSKNEGAGRKSEIAVRDLLTCAHARFQAMCEALYAGADRGQDVSQMDALKAKQRLGKGVIGSELVDDQAMEAARGVHWGGLGAGKVMTDNYNGYKRNGGSLTIGAFAKHIFLPSAEDDPGGKYLGSNAFDNMKRRIEDGVKYCDEDERAAYRLEFKGGGQVCDASGDLFDTSSRSTEASGFGWAIFVLGLDGAVYSNSHELDSFHHSSFFSGGPVVCGGELCVINGRLRYVTAKTGHYRSKLPAFLKALRHFHQCGVDLGKVLACPDPHGDKQFYLASAVLSQRGTEGAGGAGTPRMVIGAQRGGTAAGAALTPILDRFPARGGGSPFIPEWPASMA